MYLLEQFCDKYKTYLMKNIFSPTQVGSNYVTPMLHTGNNHETVTSQHKVQSHMAQGHSCVRQVGMVDF